MKKTLSLLICILVIISSLSLFVFAKDSDSPWIAERIEPLDDYDFSIAVIGDTQKITNLYPEELHHTYDWIIENKDEKKIAFSIGLGDITDYDLDKEWEVATKEIFKLDGVIPYAINQGNHDSLAQFNKYFVGSVYEDQIDGQMKAGALENTYMEFTAGGIKFLNINLDFGPSDEVLAWASEVIDAHPEHRVIISTHAYLFSTGKPQTKHEGTVPTKDIEAVSGGPTANNGIDMWNEFIALHENIFLVLNGHEVSEHLVTTQTRGANGNMVTQMLINPQNIDRDDCPTGMVAMLYFSDNANTMQVEWYSPIQGKYYRADNQFTVDLHIDDPVDPIIPPDDQYALEDFGQTHYYAGSEYSTAVADGKISEGEYSLVIGDIKAVNDEKDDRFYYLNNSNTESDLENIELYVSQDEKYIYLAAKVLDMKPSNYSDSVNFYVGTGETMTDLVVFYVPRTPSGGVECWPMGWEESFDMNSGLPAQAEKASKTYVQAKKTVNTREGVIYELVLKKNAFENSDFDKMFFATKITTSDPDNRPLDVLYFGFDASEISYKYPTYATVRDALRVHPYVIEFIEAPKETEPPVTEPTETELIETEPTNTEMQPQDAPETEPQKQGGCSSSISSVSVMFIMIIGAAFAAFKKKK